MPRRFAVLLLALAGCAAPAEVRRPQAAPATPAPAAPPLRAAPISAESAVGRWIAVDVLGDDEATRDLRRGVLEKTLVVDADGRVVLRGVDRAAGAGTAAFAGTLVGRVLTLEGIPGAATLAHEGTRLILTDPTGRRTRFIRDAD